MSGVGPVRQFRGFPPGPRRRYRRFLRPACPEKETLEAPGGPGPSSPGGGALGRPSTPPPVREGSETILEAQPRGGRRLHGPLALVAVNAASEIAAMLVSLPVAGSLPMRRRGGIPRGNVLFGVLFMILGTAVV